MALPDLRALTVLRHTREGKYTCNSLGTEFGLSVNDLKAMNSEMNSGSGLNCQ